jgi:hypothetical protein
LLPAIPLYPFEHVDDGRLGDTDVLGDRLLGHPFPREFDCEKVPQQADGFIELLLDGWFGFLAIGLFLRFLDVLSDAADAVHVHPDDVTNLPLTHAAECQLHDHHVAQQVFD